MAYNHKTSQKPYSKMLNDNADEYDAGNPGDKNYDKMLEEERKGNTDTTKDGKLVLEKQLEKERKTATYEILEKKLNKGKTGLNEFSNSFRNDDGAHPMDYFKEGEKAEVKAYNAARDKNLPKRKMDEIAGEQMIGEKTTIIGNEYKSQLLSNYDSREDFLKKNRAVKKASKELFDADGYLFAIYKTANDEGRPLSNKEQSAVDNVTETKVKIIAGLQDGWHEDFEDEASPIELQEPEAEQLNNELRDDLIDEELSGEFGNDQFPAIGDLDTELGGDIANDSESVNIFQWTQQAKAEVDALGDDSSGLTTVLDRLLTEAREKFGMDFRAAEELLRDEVLPSDDDEVESAYEDDYEEVADEYEDDYNDDEDEDISRIVGDEEWINDELV